MSERLRIQQRHAEKPLAARAVALCEGCTLATFCVIKSVAPCETKQERAEQHETGGGSEAMQANMPEIPVKRSYRRELMDDSISLVLAQLQKKQPAIPQMVQPSPVPLSPTPPPVIARTKPPLSQPKRSIPRQVRHEHESRRGEESVMIADVIASILGVNAIATSKKKKSV